MPNSLPDPDLWVLREGAEPVGMVRTFPVWASADVLLVIEVADTTLRADVTRKKAVYARGRVAHYWVVTQLEVHVFAEPVGGMSTGSEKDGAGDLSCCGCLTPNRR